MFLCCLFFLKIDSWVWRGLIRFGFDVFLKKILAVLCGLQDLSYLTRDQAPRPQQGMHGVLTTGPPRKSLFFPKVLVCPSFRKQAEVVTASVAVCPRCPSLSISSGKLKDFCLCLGEEPGAEAGRAVVQRRCWHWGQSLSLSTGWRLLSAGYPSCWSPDFPVTNSRRGDLSESRPWPPAVCNAWSSMHGGLPALLWPVSLEPSLIPHWKAPPIPLWGPFCPQRETDEVWRREAKGALVPT